ncbi:hypothetical protein M2137_000469 [Parabacteroides sp. PFB2-10]|uniref:DUF6599 family protein n=1 Tax=Parabacteroides sp. PFB2-10 TaxID=1742405 RepID=UPI002476B3D6|nr:DUF6599 family protein [Parabacteroides sp. PFB2-10]MDH6311710.1 hypothetical protein [Parabacteroides sp. PFB2-10]MDL2244969.1 hypothetical protein [Parabacteroides sp. OttesenSCG-928-J18]
MKKVFWVLYLCFACSQLSIIHSQLSVVRERVFTGQGLYGFMNGGADLFLEYGVERLTNRDVEWNGESYTIDIYEMPTPEDAFGIYSMQVFRCQEADQGGGINCLSPYQWLGVIGNRYVSVVFPSGSEAALKGVSGLIAHYFPETDSDLPAFPEKWQAESPFSGVLKYARGSISLSNISKDLSGRLKELAYKGVWFRKGGEEDSYEASVCCDNREQCEAILAKLDPTMVIDSQDTCIYIKGKESKEETPDFGPFGF